MNWVGRYNDDDLTGHNRDMYSRPIGTCITNSEVIQTITFFMILVLNIKLPKFFLVNFRGIHYHFYSLINIYNRIYLLLKKMGEILFCMRSYVLFFTI